jgi:hypothetical protein
MRQSILRYKSVALKNKINFKAGMTIRLKDLRFRSHLLVVFFLL